MNNRVRVTNLPGYDDFEGELINKFYFKGKPLLLVRFEWEGEWEYVITLEKHVTHVTE